MDSTIKIRNEENDSDDVGWRWRWGRWPCRHWRWRRHCWCDAHVEEEQGSEIVIRNNQLVVRCPFAGSALVAAFFESYSIVCPLHVTLRNLHSSPSKARVARGCPPHSGVVQSCSQCIEDLLPPGLEGPGPKHHTGSLPRPEWLAPSIL